MKIIENKEFNRINLQFDEKPSKEILQKLKDEGWRYSAQNKLWYPTLNALANSRNFAEELQNDINNEIREFARSMQDVVDAEEPGEKNSDERLAALLRNATDNAISDENTKIMVNDIKNQVIREHENDLKDRLLKLERMYSEILQDLKDARNQIQELENKQPVHTPDNNIVVLSANSTFVEDWSENHDSVKKGLFVILENDKYVAIDNTEGECYVEDMDSVEKAVLYLSNTKLSVDEIKAFTDEQARTEALKYLGSEELDKLKTDLLNSNFLIDAAVNNSLELCVHNPKTGEYLMIQSIDEEERWDYTLYDKDFKEIDGGVGFPSTADMPEHIADAAVYALKEMHPNNDLNINDWVIRNYVDISDLIRQIEDVNYLKVVENYERRQEEHNNGVEQAIDEKDSTEMNQLVSNTQRLDEIISHFENSDYQLMIRELNESKNISVSILNNNAEEVFSITQTGNQIMPYKTWDTVYDSNSNELKQFAQEYFDILDKNPELRGDYVNQYFSKSHPKENSLIESADMVKTNSVQNPFEIPVSKDDFDGFWIPHHNAKVMKRGLEENKAPFLPDSSGNIKAEPIYNGASGYCLPAGRLIPVQFAKMENGYSSNIVFPRTTVGAMENSIKENEKGVFYNFKDEQGEVHVASLFFPEQTENPEALLNATKDKIQKLDNLKDVSMVIASSEPKEYLGSYIAACRSGMKLSVDPQIAEEFKSKIMPTLENDIKDLEKRDKNIPSLSNLLFEAEKRGTEICRTLAAVNSQSVTLNSLDVEAEAMERANGIREMEDSAISLNKGEELSWDEIENLFKDKPMRNTLKGFQEEALSEYSISDSEYSISDIDELKDDVIHRMLEDTLVLGKYSNRESMSDTQLDELHEILSKLSDEVLNRNITTFVNIQVKMNEYLSKSEIYKSFTPEHSKEELSKSEQDIRDAQIKLNNIVTETFLTLTDEEKENGTTLENKTIRYEKWYKPMVDEIMADIANGNKEALTIVQNFDLDPETHVQGNKWYTAIEAFNRDVQYKLLPELYEKVQDRIKAEYEEKKIPYVVMFSSESPKFPSENKVYTVKEFNEMLLQADSEFHNRKKYAEEKYGSADNYWDLERDDKLPEEDKGIQFGYDKTNFKFFNIPNPRNPEDTFSYEPSRYDIGDGNGSVFDYVRSTCSHDDFINALNQLETQLYFPNLSEPHKQIVDMYVSQEKTALAEKVKNTMEELDDANNEYKELHKKWLIEASEADRVDEKLKTALNNIHQVYEDSVKNIYNNVFENIKPTDKSLSLETSTTLQYMSNEAKKMCIESLYLPSREAQKAMNAEDYKTYNSVDWAKLRRIWEQFPSNVNMSNWTDTLLEEKIKNLGIQLESSVVKTPSQTVTPEEREAGIKAAREVQIENARKKYESEQGSNYDKNLSTTDIARNLRNYIKKNYPGYKFSVTSKYYSGGSSINVYLKDAPVEITNFQLMKEYLEENADSEQMWDSTNKKYVKYFEMSEEQKESFINERLKHCGGNSYIASSFDDDRNTWINKEVKTVYKDIILHLESFNYDHSDSQTDYFDVNFYTHYSITEEAIENSHKHNVQKVIVKPEEQNIEQKEPAAISTSVISRLSEITSSFQNSELVLDVHKKDGKVVVHIIDSASGDMIYTKQQTGNPVMPVIGNDLTPLENDDLKNLAEEYFNIITENSDIEAKYLDNQFAKEIKEKTPLQLEIIDRARGILDEYSYHYQTLYENDDDSEIWEKEHELVKNFEALMKVDGEFAEIIRDLSAIREDAFSSDRECASIVLALNEAGYLSKISEAKDISVSNPVENKITENNKELTQEELEICKKVVPKQQLAFTLELTKGEEGEFFTNKLKSIAETYRKINTDSELINKDGTHTVGFRYFLGDTEIYLSEIDKDGIGFGYNILNGDLQMSEWGSTSLEEILSIPYMEMDYHVPEGATIEQMLYMEHPDYFAEYAPKEEVEQKKPAVDYTNEIIEKIKAAGIEVVTDKKQFDEILESEAILQKMTNDEIIRNLAKKRDDAIEEKNKSNEKKLEIFKNEVKSYAPLIKELIRTGNTLQNNGFELTPSYMYAGSDAYSYSRGHFYADEISHKFGFKSDRTGEITAVGCSLGDNGDKYFIFTDGENIDIGPYTFRYDGDYDSEPKYWLEGLQEFKTALAESFELNFDNIEREEVQKEELSFDNFNVSLEVQNIISDSLKQTASNFMPVVYSRENYINIFGNGYIETPIETVKLGQNQFIKLSPGDRNNLMLAIRQTIETPSIILGKETFDEISEDFKPVHVYGKSFINETNEHLKTIESIIVFKEGDNIAISLHNKPVEEFIRQIKTTNDIVYLDDEVSRVAAFAVKGGDSHVLKETEQLLSRVRQVSYSSLGQESYPLNPKYDKTKILSTEEFIASKGIETGKLEITKDNFDRYFNILNQHKSFKDNRNKIASELYNYHVSPENKEEMKKWLEEQDYSITEKSVTQFMTLQNSTYGFVHNGKIYLNPDLMNPNAAVHEYTHLWDTYTQKTNPELWDKGLELFKDTKYWNEVINDPNYQDIKDDENLVLSEIHARISGDIAEKVLNRIAELDSEQTKLDAIDWNKETWTYIASELGSVNINTGLAMEDLKDFLATPLNDLVSGKNITIPISKELSKIIHPEISYFVASNIEFEENLYSGLSLEEAITKYEELMNTEHSGYIPCIGIDTKDGSMYDSGSDGHGQIIFAGKNIESDVLKNIKYFRKMPEYVDAMKKLTKALVEKGYSIENANEFLEDHKDVIEVNGIKYNSYYNSLNTREICHNIAGTDLEKKQEAIKTMADWFINQGVLGPDDVLIPAPQHTGSAEYTKEIAEIVAKATGAEVADILKCEPHEPLYEQKQAATPDLDPKLFVDGNIPEGKRLILIDNVISTGITFNEANKLIPGITPMVYAITDNANLRYQYEQYYAGTLKRQNYSIYQLKHDESLHDISFASTKELKSMGKEIDFNNYEMVYSGHIDITHSMRNVNVTSEKIFEQLNNNHPDDYKAHSLSTSDIIVLEKEDGSKQAMFVDDVGFVHNTPDLLQFVERMNERIEPDSSISWNELEKFFDGHIKSQLASFETTKQEVIKERYDNEIQEKDETVGRMLMDNLDWHYFSDDGIDEENELSGKILEEKWSMIEDLEVRIVDGKVKTFEEAQIIINDQLLHSEVYEMVKGKEPTKESKPYNFFVSDTANLDLGIGEDFEPVLGLSAEQAAIKYAELKDKGFSPYIGLNIPGDFIFDDKEGRGAGIFCEIESDGKPSFYIGDNFVKDLKTNDEHAKNVLAAYKDLYEMTDKYILGVVKPDFVFDKEEELKKNILYADKVKELESQGFELKEYGLVELNNFNGPQYATYSDGKKEITLRYNMEKEDGSADSWKAGYIYDISENEIESKPLQVYTFSPFGYEGHLVQVETDLRRGIPAYDIVGLADSAVKETRERIRYAFSNSGLDFPAERVLQSLSPADLRKDAPMDLSMALGILGQTKNYPVDEPVLALGELELSGNIRPVRGAVAAVNTAKAIGITNIVCDPTTAELLKEIDGINILPVSSLKEANEKLMEKGSFQKTEPKLYKAETVEFNDEEYLQEALKNLKMDGHFGTIRAIEIAIAGKHNILATGAPGCGKTLLTQTLMPALTPKLTEEEAREPRRIASLAGLDSPRHDIHVPPFRMPHQTATIEGICGGGPNCRPGEISLAHKGTLFMDETAEFRSSVIQMLRVPLESRQITLSRAGRSTSYPADFQLAMAMNPCPCGNFGSHDKICLCSARSIEQYWKKISDPLLDRVEIKQFVQRDEKDTRKVDLEKMKERIKTAYEIQRERGVYNSHMTPEDIQKYCTLDAEGKHFVDGISDITPRELSNLLKVSLTLANMDGRTQIYLNDLKEARELTAGLDNKPHEFKYNPEQETVQNNRPVQPELIDDVSITPEQIKQAETERDKIITPVLNGEKSGMYKAFKDFEEKGVFEIKGAELKLSKNGGLTPTGWKQLQSAMQIYRNKNFETFRYILVDEQTGKVKEQLSVSSHMPNFCNVSKPNDETLKQVISKAEQDNCLIAVCHNHPSGNTTESSFDRELTESLDRSLRRNDGINKFLGHIILDHDTFNLAVPTQTPGKCSWKKIDALETEVKIESGNLDPKVANLHVGSTGALKQAAMAINDTNNWNDNFIPVAFTNADRSITGVQYYSKSFFENESEVIRNEFQFTALEAGAISAFPVITDSLWEKMSAEERSNFEAVMKAHVLNDAFTDVSLARTTITEKYDVEPGRNYYNYYRDQSDRKIEVNATWEPTIDKTLFPYEPDRRDVSRSEGDVER